MNVEARIASLFRLDEEGWARHANPWSGWSRIITGMSFIIIAIWSRVWIGWWSLVPIGLVALWLWLNPRLFAPVHDDRRWISRGVFGEKLWTERDTLKRDYIPAWRPSVFNGMAALGGVALIYGLWALDPVVTVIGACVAYAGKMIFIGDMVTLYDRATGEQPELAYRGFGA